MRIAFAGSRCVAGIYSGFETAANGTVARSKIVDSLAWGQDLIEYLVDVEAWKGR